MTDASGDVQEGPVGHATAVRRLETERTEYAQHLRDLAHDVELGEVDTLLVVADIGDDEYFRMRLTPDDADVCGLIGAVKLALHKLLEEHTYY